MNSNAARITSFLEELIRTSDHPIAAFWRSYWLETGYIQRLVRVLDKMNPLLESRPALLDIGCFGELLLILRLFYGLTSLYGTSLEGNFVGYGQKRLLNSGDSELEFGLLIDRCDVERQRLKYENGSLDVVTCFEVLEHLRYDPMFMLLEIHRVLRPGGILVLSTPNASSLESFIRVAAFESPFTFSSYFADGSGIGHCKEYSVLELERVIESAGFGIEKFESLDFSPPDSDLLRRFDALETFACSHDWWKEALRHQTLLVHARKAEAPKMRMYAPLYTESFSYRESPGERPEADSKTGGFLENNEELTKEIDRLRRYITELKAELEGRTQWALDLDEQVKTQKDSLVKLQAEFDDRGRWALELDQEVRNQRDLIAALQQKVSLMNRGRFLAKQLWRKLWRQA